MDATYEERRLAARAAGLMMLAGAALATITVLLPPGAAGSDVLILVLALGLAALGITLVALRRASEVVLGIAIALGTVAITLGTREGGLVGTGTSDNEMLYVWICLFAFNFLAFRHALAQLAFIAVGYGWLLSGAPLDEAVTRWLVSISTLFVAGLLVAHLRSSRNRLVGELEQRARVDGLTGALNRRSFEERANLELARAQREGKPVSLVIIDVDGFKRLNDAHGHPTGDAILRRIANRLELETRQTDAIARPGGDEFAVLLPGATTGDALAVAERLLYAGSGEEEPGVTLSIGVATGPPPDGSFRALWEQADAAMYEAKRAGGNAARVHGLDEPAALAAAG
ncbi:MAG TPA: GGDEF domain-containing protein [Solirubrobacterales bacterium]|jgi:diguanylate cyclase (GGDEF)-like protein